MSNLIEKVASLQELEKKATPGPWLLNYNGKYEIYQAGHGPSESRDKTVMRWIDDYMPIRTKDSDLLLSLRNAAPDLLEVLAGFQPGDAYALDQIRLWLDDLRLTSMDPGEADYETITKLLEVLQRLQAMARLMEASSK